MKIHEYQAKALFAAAGIPVAAGRPAFSVEEAVEAAEQIGGSCWAVKAQIHAGGRGKAVLFASGEMIRTVDEPDAVDELFAEINRHFA